MEPQTDTEKALLADIAYQEIRNHIVTGKLLPGDKLVVNDLVDRWKISNTPIKEALNRLVAEGLVEILPRRGMRVRMLNAKQLRDIFDLREMIEPRCCRMAIDRLDRNAAALDELRRIFAEMREIGDNAEGYVEQSRLDMQFHMAIGKLCDNEALLRLLENLQTSVLILGIYANKRTTLRRHRELLADHARIMDEIERRSPEGAARAMREHLHNSANTLMLLYAADSGRLFRPADE